MTALSIFFIIFESESKKNEQIQKFTKYFLNPIIDACTKKVKDYYGLVIFEGIRNNIFTAKWPKGRLKQICTERITTDLTRNKN